MTPTPMIGFDGKVKVIVHESFIQISVLEPLTAQEVAKFKVLHEDLLGSKLTLEEEDELLTKVPKRFQEEAR
jgi:hypothetical protein